MPDEEVVVYSLDMDNPENAAAVKEKWGKEHSTVLEPDHLAKSDLEARLAIQKGVPITNLAVPKNGVAAYLPAGSGGANGDASLDAIYFDPDFNGTGAAAVVITEDSPAFERFTLIVVGNTVYEWDNNANGFIM